MHSFIEQLSPAGALAEPAGRALLACLISFVLTMMFAPRVIRALISLKIGQPIRTAEELRLDCVVSVGTDAARITDAISPNSFTQRLNFSSAEEAAEWLRSHTAPGDIVLFKGSRLARMEQVMNLTFPPQ